ncbi:ribonuclease H-like domain-containing protein [Fennellomyces sp. T-0311]|nr:ribonuclease H-like domain-containing protein [Fennellomyces sp. T-0311]
MEILKDDFVKRFPLVADAILDADCIAIDCEFSGLRLNTAPQSQFDDLQMRYEKLREASKEFSIIQYGVCAFKKTGSRQYSAKPFNFYIFGGDTPNMTSQRSFLSSASSLQFLRSHNFDFNKWIDAGIPFYNFAETSSAVKRIDRPNTFVNRQNHINFQTLSKPQAKFMEQTRKSIDNWLQRGNTAKPLIVQTNNAFIRRLVHQELQDSKYNGYLVGKTRDTKHMSISKLTDEERKAHMRVDNIQAELNFRRVIELINQANCPVIVHNGYLDLCHTIDQFWQYLPDKVEDFKELATDMWPNIADTKYLAEFHPHLKQCFSSTVLGSLYNTVYSELSEGEISIQFADGYDRYADDQEAQHEAGYDAYMTGAIYVGFAHFIQEREAEKQAKSDSGSSSSNEEASSTAPTATDLFKADILKSHYNRIYNIRSDIPYIDLVNEEVMPAIEVPNRFYLTNVPEGITTTAIQALYPELQPMSVHWIDTSSAWVIVRHDNKVDLAQEGTLGEAKVKPFLQGGIHEREGETLNITPAAAQIELYGFQQWRTRPEFQPGNTKLEQKSTDKDQGQSRENGWNEGASDSKESSTTGSQVDTAAQEESYVPGGGLAYDDLGIPMPASFMRGKKRSADDHSMNGNKKQR